MSTSKASTATHTMQPRLICAKCKDPADPMVRIERKGFLKFVPGAKRFMCTRCGRERSRIFGISL